MRHEPAINRTALLAAIRDHYGFPGERLTFVPVGYAAACCTLGCADGARFFLKLWPPAPDGRPHPVWRPSFLALARALHERVPDLRVPYPLPARDGALWATCDGMPFAVFPFLAGHSPASLAPAQWDDLARAVATYHRATPALADVLPPRDLFAIPFEAELLASLELLARIGPAARPGIRALRDLVLPRRDEVQAQLARLGRLQPIVRRLPGPFVLCHTDLGGDNLLVDEEGQLSLLDWDEATVAPPEHDLCEGRHGDLARFLAVYAESGGSGPLHLDHFAFALLRRFLGDMAVRFLSIMSEEGSPEQDADALADLEAWGLSEWRGLDPTLETIAAALRDHRP